MGTNGFTRTHTSTFGSATGGIGSGSISAVTLCESTNTAANVITEDAFVAGVGHDLLQFALGMKMDGVEMDWECSSFESMECIVWIMSM